MTKRKWAITALLFFVLFFGGRYSIEAAKQPEGRVLFISSYSYAWETVPQQIEGIRQTLGNEVVVDYQFMDTKNVDTEESEQLFHDRLRYFLQMVSAYDVVIVGDDAAFNFALKYREELFPGIPIIFEGVNNVETAESASEDPLISGVIESLSYGNTLQLAADLFPEATQVVGILDDTVTGVGERKEFYKYASQFPELEFKEINASQLSQEELLHQVSALGKESILVYIMCSEDGDGNTYASAEAVEMISSHAEIPTFSIVSHGMGKGFLGGEIVSQKQMGVIAADMAQQIIDGTDPAELTLRSESPRTFCFDEKVMKRFHIKASDLPKDVEIINHRETFFEQHKAVVQVSVATVCILLFLIGVLTVDNQRKKKMNEAISKANEKLQYTSRYDVLTTLLNRRSFMEDMEQHIAECKKFGLIMYDLDNFKQINDTYGHNEGDVVLSELAGRSKELADEKMQVYRLAGDEFIAIVEDGRPEIVENYAKAIQETFRKPYLVSGEEQYLHSSMGMALYPRDGHNSTELISSVDKAMYTVKNSGKNGMAFYQEGM